MLEAPALLLVEDEILLHEILTMELAAAGFETVAVSGGNQALAELEAVATQRSALTILPPVIACAIPVVPGHLIGDPAVRAARKARAAASVGKPDAGKPHVRFVALPL